MPPAGYSIEHAKSARSTCRGCKHKIKKNELRIGEHKESELFGEITKWYHLKCGKFRNVKSEENVTNWDELTPKDQGLARTQLFEGTKKRSLPLTESEQDLKKLKITQLQKRAKELGLSSKGKKTQLVRRIATSSHNEEEENQEEEEDEEAANEDWEQMAKEAKERGELMALYSSFRAPDLRNLLAMNSQRKSGSKGELAARIVDCVQHGCLPRCEECGGGHIHVRYGSDDDSPEEYYCKGYFDDDTYVRCYFKTDQVNRPQWRDIGELIDFGSRSLIP